MRGYWSLVVLVIGILLAAGAVSYPLAAAPAQPSATQSPHDPIEIPGDELFNETNGVKSGHGTIEDPYVISGYDINASARDGMAVFTTTRYFVISDSSIHSGARFSGDQGLQYPSFNGITLEQVNHCVLERLVLEGDALGIGINGCRNVIVRNCTFIGNADGLSISGSNNISVMDCEFYGGHWSGLGISYSDQVVVERNVFRTNYLGADFGGSSMNITFRNNTFERTGIGLQGSYAGDSLVYSNIFSQNEKIALSFDESRNITIKKNLISENANGMLLFNSFGFTISENDFVGNHLQAYDSSPDANRWNDSSKGNFWSDYSGHDGNGNGIGDTPYEITTGVQDELPLVHEASGLAEGPSVPLVAVVIIVVAIAAVIFAVVLAVLRPRKPAGGAQPPGAQGPGGA